MLVEWWGIVLGLFALYGPTFYGLARGIWNSEEQAHGPLILLVVLYLFWEKRTALYDQGYPSRGRLGVPLLAFGLLLYVLGRSQDILLFEIGSLIPVLAGTLLAVRGMQSLRALWFAIFFIVFLIPLPGFLVDAATGPLKQHVSEIAEAVLYHAGYPIARSGVTITIGPYQLLVADACSGLHSMFSLGALGLLYLYMAGRRSWLRNGIIIASILPIAFLANVVRVIVLVLVTYHFGDAAGQGFVHGFSGMVLFIAALLSLFALDGMLGWTDRKRSA